MLQIGVYYDAARQASVVIGLNPFGMSIGEANNGAPHMAGVAFISVGWPTPSSTDLSVAYLKPPAFRSGGATPIVMNKEVCTFRYRHYIGWMGNPSHRASAFPNGAPRGRTIRTYITIHSITVSDCATPFGRYPPPESKGFSVLLTVRAGAFKNLLVLNIGI